MKQTFVRIVTALALSSLATGTALAGDAPAKPAPGKPDKPAADKPAPAAPAKPAKPAKEKPADKPEARKPAPPAEPSEPAAAAAEVKAAKGVEGREPVEEGTSFPSGTKVWVWSRITGANGTRVKHVWKFDGKELWSTPLSVKSDRWVTHSRRQLQKAGEYTVEVVAADGTSLGSVTFTIQ